MKQSIEMLPSRATLASHTRYRAAQELVTLCPLALGQEVSITGSVSKGLADDFSDIEQVFYVQKLPGTKERDTWLKQVGATDILHDDEAIEDGSIWSTFRFHNIWIEAGWQTFSQQKELLCHILAGKILDHHLLILAEVIVHALSLRSEGHLSQWKQQLEHYPSDLARYLVTDAIELWKFPHLLASRWAMLHRDEPWRLEELLVKELHNLLRVLFAVNHQCEPEWKWISHSTATLVFRPDHLMERIAAIWSPDGATDRITACFRLIYDTLVLLPPEYDVVQALHSIRESLDLYGS